ncbi:excalibur calcium-binding domain-containing protein [Crossiella sp. NPDC003009]
MHSPSRGGTASEPPPASLGVGDAGGGESGRGGGVGGRAGGAGRVELAGGVGDQRGPGHGADHYGRHLDRDGDGVACER